MATAVEHHRLGRRQPSCPLPRVAPAEAVKPRIGPRMRAMQAFAFAHPGESAATVVAATTGPYKRWVGHSSHRKALFRAEDAGLVIIDRTHAHIHRVFASEDDRVQYYADLESEQLNKTRAVADVVSAMPGCSKSIVLRTAAVPVHVLNSAITAGLVLVEYERANFCRLFATELDKQIWHLRRELLEPSTPSKRVAELRTEIDHLQAERAQTWAC
jgi:hypothetical protein